MDVYLEIIFFFKVIIEIVCGIEEFKSMIINV